MFHVWWVGMDRTGQAEERAVPPESLAPEAARVVTAHDADTYLPQPRRERR